MVIPLLGVAEKQYYRRYRFGDCQRVFTGAVRNTWNSKRRIWHGPGINNFDLTIEKTTRFRQAKLLDVRVEAFNAFNHAQFYGSAAVDGEINDPEFGHTVSAQAPRLVQFSAKFTF
jgi:hypothetical protein